MAKYSFRAAAAVALLMFVFAPWTRADPAPKDPGLAMRLLRANCLSCHNEEKHKGGLVLTSREALMKGGGDGAVVVEGRPEESKIITALAAAADPHMPPKKQLSAAQIALLSRWVKEGALWDAAVIAGQPSAPRLVSLAPPPDGYRPVLALCLSPDGSRLGAGCGNEVVTYDVSAKGLTFRARASAHPDPVQSITWTQDGRRLVTGAFRRVVVWDAERLEQESVITAGLTDRITALRSLPNGEQLVLADGQTAENGTVRILDLTTGRLIRSWSAHDDTIFDLAVSGDGKMLATAGGDKLVKIWDLATGRETAKLEGHAAQVLTVAFNADGSQLVTGGTDHQIKVWDLKAKEGTNKLGKHPSAINAVTWNAAGPAVFAVTDQGVLFRYTNLKSHTGAERSDTADERRLGSADAALYCLTTSADGERIFAGSYQGRVLGWNKDGKLVDNIDINAAPGEHRAGTPVEIARRQPAPPTFVSDVLPVLGKAGCNAGSCHAKPEGQNGFRLSVFSFDPKSDYNEIVRAARGRRVFPSYPEESLLLLKPTLAVSHEGGERFEKNSDAWRTLAEWIRTGMVYRAENEPAIQRLEVLPHEQRYRKGATQRLSTRAHYSDGSVRDVTALASFASSDKDIARVTDDGQVLVGQTNGNAVIMARFMGMVGDSRLIVPADQLLPEASYANLPVNNFIDKLAYERFRQMGLFPSEPCTDAEFLRRASLDSIGVLPTLDEARKFLADADPQKRAKAIDRLLAHPAYGDYWANKWADLLRPNPDRVGIKSVYLLDQWLRESFRANKPYDQFVREIVLAQGNTHRVGPAVIYRDRREPEELTTMFSQLFFGVRLECAKCHHHPNEKWSQDDFFRMAAFFGPLKRAGAGLSPPISGGNETVFFTPGKSVKHPVTDELMEPQPPDGPPVKASEKEDPRHALADWMTDASNPFVARAAANRVWANFFGRGIVDPVDDFRLSNPPSHPELLEALAQEFVRVKYDLKALMRIILSSHLYQLSAAPNNSNRADTRHFSRALRRRLPAEVLADAVADITGVPDNYPGLPPGSRAMQAWTYKIESRTMDAFGRPNSSSDCPCERNTRPSIVQSLHLMNARSLQEKLASTDNGARVQRLVASAAMPAAIVDELYLACYGRAPADEEIRIATAAFTAEGAPRRSAVENILWALLNSAEFVFNH